MTYQSQYELEELRIWKKDCYRGCLFNYEKIKFIKNTLD